MVIDPNRYGPWALITGASAGIGLCFARQLAADGFNCVLVARREERLRELAAELTAEHGVEARVVAADLSDAGAVGVIAEATADVEIGLLVNNAGFGDAGGFHERSAEKLAAMIDVNCRAVTLLTHHYLPGMLERKRGGVVIVSSVLGIVPCPYETAYGATKAFDLSFGLGLYGELKDTGVDCITVCPGTTDTEFLLAEGMPEERVKQIYKTATPPETIVKLALKGLGRKAVTGPGAYHGSNVMSRLLPRAWQAGLVRRVFERIMGDRIGR